MPRFSNEILLTKKYIYIHNIFYLALDDGWHYNCITYIFSPQQTQQPIVQRVLCTMVFFEKSSYINIKERKKDTYQDGRRVLLWGIPVQ